MNNKIEINNTQKRCIVSAISNQLFVGELLSLTE